LRKIPRTSVQKTGPGLPRTLPVARTLCAVAAAEAFDLAAGALGAPRRHLRRLGLEPRDDIHPFA
jgi:hypothetical protein